MSGSHDEHHDRTPDDKCETLCWHCWRDWEEEFLALAPWEQDQFLMLNPRINPNLFHRGRCPFCGERYNGKNSKYSFRLMSESDTSAVERAAVNQAKAARDASGVGDERDLVEDFDLVDEDVLEILFDEYDEDFWGDRDEP